MDLTQIVKLFSCLNITFAQKGLAHMNQLFVGETSEYAVCRHSSFLKQHNLDLLAEIALLLVHNGGFAFNRRRG